MLLKKKEAYTIDYQKAMEFIANQEKILWFESEINVDKDIQDILVNMTEAERHGVITTLKLFTKYETIIGNEYWQSVVFDNFQHPADIQRMAKLFSFMELCVHTPFYNKINKALNLDNEKFYTEWLNDPALYNRIASLQAPIDDLLNGSSMYDRDSFANALISLSLAEGVILYSNFAFLKHFQSQGKNKIVNIVRGINFSVRDEALHCEASAWLFKTFCKETDADLGKAEKYAVALAEEVYEHELAIIDKIYAKGEIEGLKKEHMIAFVQSRINLVLNNLGFASMFYVETNPIADWFYTAINSFVFNDFFTGQGNQYARGWEESEFKWD